MGVTKINNQAVALYSDTENNFNENTGVCKWHLDYFPLVTCEDITEIVLNTTLLEQVQFDGDFAFNTTGTNTNVVVGSLSDTGVNFITLGVLEGMIVRNTTDALSPSATILTVSANELTLDANIFTSSPENYSITRYTLTGNFSMGTGEIVKTDGASGTMKQSAILVEDNMYKFEIDLTSFSSTIDGAQIIFKIGGNTVLVLDESTFSAETITMYGYANGITPTEIEIYIDNGIAATFSTLRVGLMDNLVFFVLDCETDTVQYTSAASDVLSSLTSAQIKLSFDWSNLQNGYDCLGCYYIGIITGIGLPNNLNEDRINDGTFDGSGWNYGTYWATTGTTAVLTAVGGGGGDLTQTNLAFDFSKRLSYDVTFELYHMNGSFDLKLFNGATEVANLGTFTTNGTFTVSTGILTANCDTIKFIPSPATTSIEIDNVSAVLNVVDSDFDLRTDCFQLKDSHDCTVKLSGTNYDNAFGIDFIGLAYNPFIRISAELMIAKYKGKKENEEDSDGVSKTLYFKSEKVRDLFIWLQPEYVHDFLRLLIGYDEFLIDGVYYLCDSAEYTTQSERMMGKQLDLSNATVTVRLIDDLNVNKFC